TSPPRSTSIDHRATGFAYRVNGDIRLSKSKKRHLACQKPTNGSDLFPTVLVGKQVLLSLRSLNVREVPR
ncbi:MAG: hypothetical protein ACI9VX_002160, partial [Dinoroseobacter sp.]